MNYFGEIHQLLRVLWRRWWLIALFGIIAGYIGYYVSMLQQPTYEANVSLIVGRLLQPGVIERADVQLGQQLTVAYADLARRRPVMQAVADSLYLGNWESLRRRVRITPIESSQLLEIRVQDTNPIRAQQTANALAQQLIALKSTNSTDAGATAVDVSTDNTNANMLAIFEDAIVPTKPISPNIRFNTFLAALVGLFLAAGLILWLELADDRIRSTEEILQFTDLPLLQSIRSYKKHGLAEQFIINQDPSSKMVDDYHMLRTKVEHLAVLWPQKTLLLTSPVDGWANSLACANLGVALARGGKRVIIVDANLRSAKQHHLFQLSATPGLAEQLDDHTIPLGSYLYQTPIRDLAVLPAGQPKTYPAELLGGQRIHDLVQELSQKADIILFDSISAGALPDTLVLSRHVQGVIMNVELNSTPRTAVVTAVTNLEQAGATIVGMISTPFVLMRRGDRAKKQQSAQPIRPTTNLAHSTLVTNSPDS